MEYIGIAEKFQDVANKWMVRVNVGNNETIFLKFQSDPTEEEVEIATLQYIAALVEEV